MDLWLDSPYMAYRLSARQKIGNERRGQAADFGVKHLHGFIR